MDIFEIRDKYNSGAYRCDMEIPKMVKEGYVFDENLSVKRNREMVAEHNQNVERMRKEKNNRQNKLCEQLTKDVVDYIANNYDMNEAQARIVEGYVYKEKHSYMSDYFCCVDDVAQMVESVIKAGKNN